MEMSVGSRLKHAWNAFLGNEFFKYSHSLGPSYSYRPDRPIFSRGNERSIITSVYNRIALDAASIGIQHVRLDDDGRFTEVINSSLNGHRAHGYRPRPGDRLVQDRNDAYRENRGVVSQARQGPGLQREPG